MPAPILVGFDPDRADRAPVHFAIAAARLTGAPLVVGAVHADAAAISEVAHGHVDGDLLLDPAEPLDHLRRELASQGTKVEIRAIAASSTARALHETAERIGAGLVVVGSASGGDRGIVKSGSTAARLLHGAPCPVAVVPQSWEAGGGLNTIGVAYIDTPEGHEALQSAVALARAAGAKLRVLSAAKPHEDQAQPEAGRLPSGVGFETIGPELRAAIERATTTATGGTAGVEIEPDVSVQDPADFLIAASGNLDLLICGSRGYGPARAVLVGGVSRRVSAEAHCPVIVLVRGAEAGLEVLLADRAGATA